MPVVRKAYPADVELVLPLLRQFKHTSFTDKDWRKLFAFYWPCEETYVGYVMLEGEQAIGYMGTFFSERVVAGEKKKFCGLSSWIVDENFRQHSLLMLVTILNELKAYSITNFTPIPEADTIFRKLRWEYFESGMWWVKPGGGTGNARVEEVNAANAHNLSEADRRIYEDHKQFKTDHLLITIGEEKTYVVLRPYTMSLHRFVTAKWITYPNALWHRLTGRSFLQQPLALHRLVYCNHYERLNRISAALTGYYKSRKGERGIFVDARFVTRPLHNSIYCPIIKLLYKPNGVPAHYVDALYTEAFILNH